MSSINSDAIDAVTKGIDRIDILDSEVQTCANCGKEGNSEDMNTCNKCKSVRYCNAACKKKHRSKHKKACDRRVSELHEEALFADPPPPEECPICMLPMPNEANQVSFHSCCGKDICNGCKYSMMESEGGADLCPYCRTPATKSDEQSIKEIRKLMNNGNAYSFNFLAFLYAYGRKGLPQDDQKANKLYLKAGELGCVEGYHNLAISYREGWRGVEIDKTKAKYYWELAAMNGDIYARHNLGCDEGIAGNHQRAMMHLMIAARAGYEKSLDVVKDGFMKGFVTKEDYANTLRAYYERQKEMKSDARDKAAASDNFSSD